MTSLANHPFRIAAPSKTVNFSWGNSNSFFFTCEARNSLLGGCFHCCATHDPIIEKESCVKLLRYLLLSIIIKLVSHESCQEWKVLFVTSFDLHLCSDVPNHVMINYHNSCARFMNRVYCLQLAFRNFWKNNLFTNCSTSKGEFWFRKSDQIIANFIMICH